MNIKHAISKFYTCSKTIGFLQTLSLLPQWIRGHVLKNKSPYPLRSKDAKHTLWCRPGTSDFKVFHQVFVDSEYSALKNISNVDLIIDCGANVGYTSSYLLTQFPTCTLIAVEPDEGNFSMMVKNISPYGDRAKPIHCAVWSHVTHLKIDRNYRDGADWSVQVRESDDEDPSSFLATDIPNLLKQSGKERISILKMDIEGAEAIVFSEHYDKWLHLVDTIAIELHEDSCFGPAAEVFYKSCGEQFKFSSSGELIIGTRVA